MIYHHELVHKDRQKVYCRETVTGVVMDLKTRRKVEVPDIYKEALDKFKNKA